MKTFMLSRYAVTAFFTFLTIPAFGVVGGALHVDSTKELTQPGALYRMNAGKRIDIRLPELKFQHMGQTAGEDEGKSKLVQQLYIVAEAAGSLDSMRVSEMPSRNFNVVITQPDDLKINCSVLNLDKPNTFTFEFGQDLGVCTIWKKNEFQAPTFEELKNRISEIFSVEMNLSVKASQVSNIDIPGRKLSVNINLSKLSKEVSGDLGLAKLKMQGSNEETVTGKATASAYTVKQLGFDPCAIKGTGGFNPFLFQNSNDHTNACNDLAKLRKDNAYDYAVFMTRLFETALSGVTHGYSEGYVAFRSLQPGHSQTVEQELEKPTTQTKFTEKQIEFVYKPPIVLNKL